MQGLGVLGWPDAVRLLREPLRPRAARAACARCVYGKGAGVSWGTGKTGVMIILYIYYIQTPIHDL